MTEDNQNNSNDPVVIETAADRDGRKSPIPVMPQLGVIFVLLCVLLVGSLLSKALPEDKQMPAKAIVNKYSDQLSPQPIESKQLESHFADLEIQAKAAYVWDIQNQQALFSRNAGEALPLASVTKLMTALVAHEILSEDESVSIDIEAARQDSSSGLPIGSSFSREDISRLALLDSSNDGAYALASAAGAKLANTDTASAFVAAMNVRAEEIGLTSTHYKNPTGLDISPTEPGAVGSARDMAFLYEYIIKNSPEILETTTISDARVYTETGEYIDAHNTNYYIDEIPGLIGSKTGYTDLAGGNLTIAYNAGLNRPVVVVVLGSTQFARFTDVIKIVEKTNSLLGTE